jgi:hypothetical protein
MDEIDFGVCRLSVVPVRQEANHRAEQVTQLLFGDHYRVLEKSADRNWMKVRLHFDQYEGWIDGKQHQTITPEYFNHINHAEFKITTDLTSTLLYNKSPEVVFMGSMIPISSSERSPTTCLLCGGSYRTSADFCGKRVIFAEKTLC